MYLLKKIDQSRFPDEEPSLSSVRKGGGGSEDSPVPGDVKKLIPALLKRNPVGRVSFDELFGSTALAKLRFPRQRGERETPTPTVARVSVWREGRGGREGLRRLSTIV